MIIITQPNSSIDDAFELISLYFATVALRNFEYHEIDSNFASETLNNKEMTQTEIAIAHELGHMLGRYIWAGNIDTVEYFQIQDGAGYTHSTTTAHSKYLKTQDKNHLIGQMMYGLGGMVMERIFTKTTHYDLEAAANDLDFLNKVVIGYCKLDEETFNTLRSEVIATLENIFRDESLLISVARFVKYISKRCKVNKLNKFKPTIFYAFFPRKDELAPLEVLQYFRQLWEMESA